MTKATTSFAAAVFAAILLAPAAAVAQERTLIAITPGGQLVDTLKEASAPFEKEHNVKIQWITAGSATEAAAKVAATKASPEYDVAFLDDISHQSVHSQGVWAPFDDKLMPNLKDVVPGAVPASHDRVSYGALFGGIAYRTDEFEKNHWPAPTSWDDLFKKEYCGRAGLFHPNVSYGLSLLIMLSGGDINKIDTGIAKLAANKDCIPALDTSTSKFEEKLQTGDYVIANLANTRSQAFLRRGLPIKFVIPKEGVVILNGVVAVVRDDAKPDQVKLAQEFVNWIVGPESQETLMKRMYFTPINVKVKIPAEFSGAMLTPEQAKGMVPMPVDAVVEKRRDIARNVDRVMAK